MGDGEDGIVGDWLDRLNIRQKIMACFSLGFLLCLLVLGIVLSRMISGHALEQAQVSAVRQMKQMDVSLVSLERLLKTDFMRLSQNSEIRQGAGLTVYSQMEGNENGILEMNPEGKGGFEERAYHIFQDFAKSHEKVTAAVTYGMQDGGYVQYPAVTRENNYDPRNTYWYRDGMAAGESGLLYVSQPFQGSHGKPVIGFYSLVWNPGDEPAGVLGFQLDLASLLGMTVPEETGKDGLMVLDKENTILIDENHPDAVFRKIADADLGDISLTGQKDEGIHRVMLDREEKYAVIYTSETTGLKYIKLLDADEVMAGVGNVRIALALLLLAAVVMSVLGSRWLAVRITAPFRAMEEKAEAIGAGRLREAGELAESDDEVGRLSLAFQEMAGQLRGRLEGIKADAGKLAAAFGQLTEEVASCRKSAEEVAGKASAMTSAEEAQGKTVGEVAGQLDGLAESLERASDGMKEIGKVTHQLGRTASDGQEEMQKASQGLSEAQKRIASTSTAAEALDKKAVQATEMVKSIGEMAEQLNLLALNAAVESARVGSGKERNKFTAVAEEVRQLSEQSSKAARKASLVISALQQEAQQASAAVKDTEEAVRFGKECVRQRTEEFRRLEGQLEHIDKILEGAFAAIQSLDGSGKRTKAAAEQVEWGTRKSADAAGAVAKAVQEQSQSLEKLERLSKDLSGTVKALQSRTDSFEI